MDGGSQVGWGSATVTLGSSSGSSDETVKSSPPDKPHPPLTPVEADKYVARDMSFLLRERERESARAHEREHLANSVAVYHAVLFLSFVSGGSVSLRLPF